MKKLFCILFIMLSVLLSAWSVDGSYIQIETSDWQVLQEYVTNSQIQLKEAKNELQIVNQNLEESLKQVKTLRQYSESIQSQLQKTKTWNKVLIGGCVISLAINVVLILILVK